MEIHYNKWLELKILHQYFSDGKIPISLVPTQGTTMIMERNNILVRIVNGVFEFYIGLDSVDMDHASVIENLENLEFEINIEDSLFFNYTDLSPINSEEYYLYRNLLNSSDLKMEKASSEALEEQFKVNSIGILQINVSDLQTESLTLSFDTRKVFSLYKIIVPNNRNIEIIVQNIYGFNNEKYDGPFDELVGGQNAQVFTSTVPLPLRQSRDDLPILKLYFKDNSTNMNEEIEIALPNPSPKNLTKTENNQLAANTIVYV